MHRKSNMIPMAMSLSNNVDLKAYEIHKNVVRRFECRISLEINKINK